MPAFNPLDEIRIGAEYEMADVQKIANLIIDPGGRGLETHWKKTSQALLVGLILHVLYRRKGGHPTDAPRLGEIGRLLSGPQRDLGVLWDEMLDFDHFHKPDDAGVGKNRRTHATVAKAARNMKDTPYDEASAVLSTARSFLSPYRDPTVGPEPRI